MVEDMLTMIEEEVGPIQCETALGETLHDGTLVAEVTLSEIAGLPSAAQEVRSAT